MMRYGPHTKRLERFREAFCFTLELDPHCYLGKIRVRERVLRKESYSNQIAVG